MRSFANKHKHFLLLLLIFVICEIIVNPVGEFPLNDDWAYSKSVSFALNGVFTIGDFGAMTLFTHLLWGTIFTKIFGFSFTVLRFSTLASSVIGLFFLNKLVVKISNNQWLAFFSCLLLLLNPLYFNLANTYMTDINFTTLLIISCYCAVSFFETKKESYIVYFFLSSLGLVLIRQFGVILPICFFFACLTLKEKKIRYAIISFLVIAFTIMGLKVYESMLKGVISAGAAYTFSGSIDLLSATFWQNLFDNISIRYRVIIVHVLLYTFPITIIYFFSVIKTLNKIYVITLTLICTAGIYLLLKDGVEIFPFHNIFTNMALGPETFYQHKGHAQSEDFQRICDVVKYIFCSATIIILFLFISSSIRSKITLSPSPAALFIICLIPMYIFMILITQRDVYFDRYHIPLIAISIILFSFISKTIQPSFTLAVLSIMCFFYVSVFGTKDYLSLNRNRWKAYNFIKEKTGVGAEKINGGFEVNCWNDGKNNWWMDYVNLQNYDYLIQFKKEKGFETLRNYEFQRYFPYKKDTIRLQMRADTSKVAPK